MDGGENSISFFVNGKKVTVQIGRDAQPDLPLVLYLRESLGLVGSKTSCDSGGCGACTVMISSYDKTSRNIFHIPVNACFTPLCAVDGMAVTTLEGIGSTKTRLHPVQERIAKAHGSQCGFCTPGMVMSMYTLLRNHPSPSPKDIETAIGGNLCRCTGYRPIYEGFKTFSQGSYCQGDGSNGPCCQKRSSNESSSTCRLFNAADFTPYDPTQEPIFPPELMLSQRAKTQSQPLRGNHVTWLRPMTVQQALELVTRFPTARRVSGFTGVGVGKGATADHPVTVISLSHVPDLNIVTCSKNTLAFGPSVTMATMESSLRDHSDKLSEPKSRATKALLHMLSCYGNKQVRHMFSLSSNILPAAPTSDLNVLLVALGAELTVISTKGGQKTVLCDDKFFQSAGKTSIAGNELLVSVTIPLTKEQHEYVFFYRQIYGRGTASAVVNAGMRVHLESAADGSHVVKDCCIAYGNVASTTVMARKTMGALRGRVWDNAIVECAFEALAQDIVIPADAYQAEYKQSLVKGFFFKFYQDVTNSMNQKRVPETCSNYKSFQTFEAIPDSQDKLDTMGHPLSHLAASQQATGEAMFVNDIPPRQGELYVARILSQRAHAKILSVDVSAAIAVNGVHAYLCAADLKGTNDIGLIPQEELFASDEVLFVGQTIGAVVAESKEIAQRAAELVNVSYKDLPTVLTIQDAIAADQFFEPTLSIQNGDVDEGFAISDHVIEGELYSGGQEHFYMETQASLAVPGENDEMEVYSSTQNPTFMQVAVAKVLGVPFNRVIVRTKRIGGGFGGKLTNSASVAAAVALAAQRTGRAVRCVLGREEDMKTTGKREDYLLKYKFGFTKEGQIRALKAEYLANSGSALDLSIVVLEQCLLNVENCYVIPNIHVSGRMCRTNLPPRTAMRSLSACQTIMFTESLIADAARTCGIPERKVRELNLFKEGDLTAYNQPLTNCTVQRVWNELMETCDYDSRRSAVDAFNRESRWKKRGLVAMPCKYGIAIVLALCQGSSLVHVYTDGTVLVAHGGIEMGQGLHTKITQIAALTLGIPVAKIFISETATNTVPNTSPSGASFTLDLNGPAVKIACEEIVARLAPYKSKHPDGNWEKWVQAAYFDRVSLSATGFYKTPDVGYDWATNTGYPFAYFVYGAGCTEVEIDCLTGDHRVLRTDIVMDFGKSLNPAIDVGQIEGAFVQGLGFFTFEELRYSRDGELITCSRRNYKIPSLADIPAEFNVHILENSRNDKAINSSKAVGEPALCLSPSVFLAIKAAVASARQEVGLSGMFRFDSPATCERIRMACGDQLNSKVISH